MGSKGNRRLRRAESQSSHAEGNLSETSIAQGNDTLTNVSENAEYVFDKNLGSELTELSQINNKIEGIAQILTEQNNTKMTQIDEQLSNKFEEILKDIRTNRNYTMTNDEEDAENSQQGPSNSKNRSLRNKHASNTARNRDKNQDDGFYPSAMSELRQPYTFLGIASGTLDETVIINENGCETDHHTCSCYKNHEVQVKNFDSFRFRKTRKENMKIIQ